MSVVVRAIALLSAVAIASGQVAVDTNDTTPERRLLFVAELCRHGDRSPLYEFPSDALPASKWPEGIGKLTAIGMRAHYELGTRLRERYVDSGFLPSSYSPADVYIRSTDIDRTLMSAVSQFTGFYPPGTAANADVRVRFGKDALHENEGGLPHLFQPVPVHTESRETDQLLLLGNFCPRHKVIMGRKRNTPGFLDFVEENAEFLEEARKIAGKQGRFTIFDLEHLSDTWTVFAAHSVPLPQAATPDIVGKARNLSNWLVTFGNEGLEVNRLRAGLLLHEINRYMVAAALRDEKKLPPEHNDFVKKFALFSAHDTTVAATLAAMRVFDGTYPPYNSTVFWELYKSDDGSLSVRVEYNGKPLILPGCSQEYCPAYEYADSIRDRVVRGQEARELECLTGWRWLAATAYHFLSKKTDDGLSEFASSSDDSHDSSSRSILMPTVLMLVVAVISVAGAIRVHLRYKEYNRAPTFGDAEDEHRLLTNRDMTSDNRILM